MILHNLKVLKNNKALFIPAIASIMAALAASVLIACSDDDASTQPVPDTSLIADEKIMVVSNISDLPDCWLGNEGKQVLVKGETSPRICVDGEWFLPYAETKDFKCSAEYLADGSGLKISCNGDSVGVLLNGENGTEGLQGLQGERGVPGDKGDVGEQGVQGEKGDKGDTGEQGIQGEKGDKGDTGEQGIQGEKGDKGDTGEQGIQGEKGDKGDTGEQGVQGEKGDKGDAGEQGIQGEKGDKGDTGEQGIQGEKGDKGDTGEQGIQGEKGDKGDTGEQGVQGEKGDKGDTGEQGVQGEKGDKGDKGADCAIAREGNVISIDCGDKNAVLDVNEIIANYKLGTCSVDNENKVKKFEEDYYICRANIWDNLTASGLVMGTMIDDRDQQSYNTVVIGTQIWMAENLNYAYKFSETDSNSYCQRDSSHYCNKYGRLYTWAAAMDSAALFSDKGANCGYKATCSPTYPVRGVCPKGWHLPSQEEWEELLIKADGTKTVFTSKNVSGKKLKAQCGWNNNGNGSDTFGFTSVAAGYGYRYGYSSSFSSRGSSAYFWSSSFKDDEIAYSMSLYYDRDNASFPSSANKYLGYSVRCIKN